MLHSVKTLRGKTVLNVLQRTDAFRRPERFRMMLNVCLADTQGQAGAKKTKPTPSPPTGSPCSKPPTKWNSDKIAAECRAQEKAHLIAEEIDRARLAQIAPLQKAYKTEK